MSNEITNPIGTEDGTGMQGSRKSAGMNEFVMTYIGEAKSKGEFQVITYDGDEATCPNAQDPATLAVYQEVGVLTEAVTTAGFYWVQVKGKVEALVDGTDDVAKDDYLEVLNGAISAIKDATARSVNSVAIACEAQATAGSGTLADVILLGGRVIIAGS